MRRTTLLALSALFIAVHGSSALAQTEDAPEETAPEPTPVEEPLEETVEEAARNETPVESEVEPAGLPPERDEHEASPEEEESDELELGAYGYLRAMYEYVDHDPNFTFVGRNSGFSIENLRVGLTGTYSPAGISFRGSVEGASRSHDEVNEPIIALDVRMRDAFVRWDPVAWLGVQIGQFEAPFAFEEIRSETDLLFPGLALTQEGVLVGRGLEEPPVAIARQIGVMLSPKDRIALGPLGLRYYAMLMSGNGINQGLDDNGKPAVVGRLELSFGDYATLGGAFLYNPRTVGALPDLFDEDDLGVATDLHVEVLGFELVAQLVYLTTSFDTTGTEDRERLGWHAELGYHFDTISPVPIILAYRFAMYEPWLGRDDGDPAGLSATGLRYHTIGIRADYPDENVGLSAFVSYTFTDEDEGRELDNNRLQVMAQLAF
jgi:hypothetical protein